MAGVQLMAMGQFGGIASTKMQVNQPIIKRQIILLFSDKDDFSLIILYLIVVLT
jgi:hypothetical protein